MRTLAHRLVETRYVEKAETTRFVVLPLPGTGLPPSLIDSGQPVPLDLLAGRPVNLELDHEGLSADLCFSGPPVRCHFPWESVIAVQNPEGAMVQTLVVTVAVVMEDDSIRPAAREHLATIQPPDQERGSAGVTSRAPPIAVIEGEGREATTSHARATNMLQLVRSPDTSEGGER